MDNGYGSNPTPADSCTPAEHRANPHVSSWSRVPAAPLNLCETLRDIATDLEGEDWRKSAAVVRHAASEIEATRGSAGNTRTEREYKAMVELYENSARQRNSIKADREVMREELLFLRGKVADLTAELDRHLASLLRASVSR